MNRRITIQRRGIFSKMSVVLMAMGFVACAQAPSSGELFGSADDSKIIGGQRVAETDPVARSVVLIYNQQTTEICTGSVLAQDLVVTAAHCVPLDPSALLVVFQREISTAPETPPTGVPVAAARVNPQFLRVMEKMRQTSKVSPDSIRDMGDIALLRFDGGLPSGYEPAVLLSNPNFLKKGLSVTIAGFGETNGVLHNGEGTLQKTEVKIKSANYGQAEVALDQRQGKGACQGDSGGPAFITVKGRQLLFGVTSRMVKDPKNDCSTFSIYTNASADSNRLFLHQAADQLRSSQTKTIGKN